MTARSVTLSPSSKLLDNEVASFWKSIPSEVLLDSVAEHTDGQALDLQISQRAGAKFFVDGRDVYIYIRVYEGLGLSKRLTEYALRDQGQTIRWAEFAWLMDAQQSGVYVFFVQNDGGDSFEAFDPSRLSTAYFGDGTSAVDAASSCEWAEGTCEALAAGGIIFAGVGGGSCLLAGGPLSAPACLALAYVGSVVGGTITSSACQMVVECGPFAGALACSCPFESGVCAPLASNFCDSAVDATLCTTAIGLPFSKWPKAKLLGGVVEGICGQARAGGDLQYALHAAV